MEKDLELTIYASKIYMMKWLENFLPSSGTNIRYLGEDEDIDVYIRTPHKTQNNEDIYLKLIGSPQHREMSDGVHQFFVSVKKGSLKQIENDKALQKEIPFLKIIERSPEISVIHLDISKLDIYAYVKELAQEISIEWPETRRDIKYNDPLDSLALDKKIFDITIESKAKQFINWCHERLSQTHPSSIIHQVKDIEITLQTSFDILPPNQFTSYWEYLVYGIHIIYNRKKEDSQNKIITEKETISTSITFSSPKRKNRQKRFRPYWVKRSTSEFEKFRPTSIHDFIVETPQVYDLGPIVSIKALKISENRLSVSCFCEVNNNQIIEWLENLKSSIINNFIIHYDAENPNNETKHQQNKQAAVQTQRKLRARGPSDETKARAALFKRYIQVDPSQSSLELINQVNTDHGTNYTIDDLKNTFKAVGWHFKQIK